MKPTISVIMPFYNRADLLAETLDSVLAQTYTDFELIGVDDGSTDNAPEIFKSYAEHDQRFKLYTKKHTNAGDARNLGYKHSCGEYLIFLDSDDLIEPNFFEIMLSTIQQEHSDIAACVADEFDHETKETIRVRSFNEIQITKPITTLTQTELKPYLLFTIMRTAVWNRIFKRSLIEQYHLHFQSLQCYEELYFSLASLIYANRVTFIDHILIHHRMHYHDSLSNPNNLLVDRFNVCLALDYLKQKLPKSIFQTLSAKFYKYYFIKTYDGIICSDFEQGYRIFVHARSILTGHLLPIAQGYQSNDRKQKFIIALMQNNFEYFYHWSYQKGIFLKPDDTINKLIIQNEHKPKITLFIIHLTDGGAERAISLWAKLLANANYDVTVLTYYPSPNEYKLDRLVKRANLFTDYQDYSQCKNKNIIVNKLLEKYLKDNSPDILIPFLTTCNLASTFCNQNLLKILTQTIRDSPWDKDNGFKLILRDWAIQRQGSVILQNDEQAQYFSLPQYKHVKKYIVHNPLNPEILKIKKETYRPIKKIVAVGRLVSQKNHALMIEAIKILRDEYHENYELDIYGDGILKDELEEQINKLKLNSLVKLCGRRSNIFELLTDYDLFLMTSLYEGTPNALLEAMGLGLPSLAIKCRTGITELIDNGKNGYILESYDAHDLAKKIHLINNQTQLEQIGKQARQDMITRYSPSIIQAELVSVIEDILNTTPRVHSTSLKPALDKILLETKTDYQSYFESSLNLIKIADYKLAKQIFNHARRTLKRATFNAPTSTKKLYAICLNLNKFNVFYNYLHTSLINENVHIFTQDNR